MAWVDIHFGGSLALMVIVGLLVFIAPVWIAVALWRLGTIQKQNKAHEPRKDRTATRYVVVGAIALALVGLVLIDFL